MSRKILIVDDEPSIVVPLQFLMEQNGYEVKTAATGEEGIEALSTFRPDAVLLDIMLPGMDGFEACQRIREIPEGRDARIIFLTAMGREMDIAKGMSLEPDDYITKPFSNADVAARVRKLFSD
jgi:two-component system, OmpR family, alkaline phosphatase synthesis response regulator PhoP